MVPFLIIGVVGAAMLLITLIVDDIFDGLFDALDVFDNGLFGGPAISAFLAAFGFGGALALNADQSIGVAVLCGLAGGVIVGGIAAGVSRALLNMHTDGTVSADRYVGLTATVVTAIGDGTFGEVSIFIGGQPVKLGARAATPIAAGQTVHVTAVLSPTSVLVETR